MELVPWQIGRASGRLRARIGPLIDAPALGSLIRRLCAGPHPVAPRDRAARTTAPVTLRRTERDTRTRTCAILTGDLASATRWRLDAIADHMQAVGMTVATLATSDELPDRVADASIVLLSGTPLDDTLRTIVAARHDNGRPTVLDLQPRDVTGVGDRVPVLTEDAARLAEMCGRVTSFGGALHRAALDLGVRALAMPTLLTRRHAAALRAARTSFDPSELVIGLSVGTPNDTDTQYREAAAVGLAKVLADNRDATVSANCEPQDVPALVRSQVQAGGRQDRAAVETAAWFVHLFTPAFLGDEPLDDMLPFTEVAQAGVPTIMPAAARAAVDGFVSPALLVGDPNDPEEWSVALQQVVESTQRRGTLSIEVRQRADAINTAATSKAMINRLVGWAATGTKS
jgi:hypothetical protein